MNELQVFTYGDTPLRTVEKDGEVWWVLKDVCGVLGISNHSNVFARLDDDEKDALHLADPMGRMQSTSIINEPGLYNVILRSDKPEAKDFKRWVTHEVLPTIRHTGSYSLQQPMSAAQLIAAQAQVLVDMEKRMDAQDVKLTAIAEQTADLSQQTHALTTRVDSTVKAFSRPSESNWKVDTDMAIKELCASVKWSLPKYRGKIYAELEARAGCSLNARVVRARNRLRKNGATYNQAMAFGKLDCIAADKKLRDIFNSIIREHQAAVAGAPEQTVIDADFVEVAP